MSKQNRETTNAMYLRIWRQFNRFLIQLDVKPLHWEDRVNLFIGHKISEGMQSSSVKSYVSAIKKTLITDGYEWNDNRLLANSLSRACKLINDRLFTRLPISDNLLELILFEVQRKYSQGNQHFLEIMFKTLFALSYYGMIQVSELTLTDGGHAVKAKDVHLATNKNKLLMVLYTSKTHRKSKHPQKIKITNSSMGDSYSNNRYFCPFHLTNDYMLLRGTYRDNVEHFFVFRHQKPVTAQQAHDVLKAVIGKLGLDPSMYRMHSFRVGRTSDLINQFHQSVEVVKCQGRWKLLAVYRYIHN